MSNRTPLYVRKQPGGMFTIEDVADHPGNIWFVGSDVTGASDTAGYGRNPDAPFATLDYAVGQCTANNGDTIYVLPSHSETKSATGAQVTLDVAGVRVVGLGNGSDRPTFTFSHTGATWTWSAANCSIENLLFVAGVDSVVTFATISGDDAKIVNCETRDTTDIEVITDFTCTGDRLVVDGLFKNGYTGGNANVRVLSLSGVDRAEIKNCRFITKVTTAVIGFVASSTAVEIHDCDFLVTSTTDYSKNVVVTAGTNTWSCWNVFDLGAGASFSGGSGAALAGDDVAATTSYAVSVGTQLSGAYANLTSSATSVGTVSGSYATSTQTNLTSSATSVGTASGSYATSTQTNLTSSATSVGTASGSYATSTQTNLTSSATSVGTADASLWTSWNTTWSTAYANLMSGIEST